MEIKPPIILVGLFKETEKLFETYSSESGLCRLQTGWVFAFLTLCNLMAYFLHMAVILNLYLSIKFSKIVIPCSCYLLQEPGQLSRYVSGLGAGLSRDRGSYSRQMKRFFCSLKRPYRLWGSACLFFNEYGKLFLRGQSGRSVKVTTHPMKYRGQELVQLFIHSSICFYGIVINNTCRQLQPYYSITISSPRCECP